MKKLPVNENELILAAMEDLRRRGLSIHDYEEKLATGPLEQPRHSKLAKEMETRALTERDVADMTGLKVPEVIALSRGYIKVTDGTAKLLAAAFATSVEFWLGGTSD